MQKYFTIWKDIIWIFYKYVTKGSDYKFTFPLYCPKLTSFPLISFNTNLYSGDSSSILDCHVVQKIIKHNTKAIPLFTDMFHQILYRHFPSKASFFSWLNVPGVKMPVMLLKRNFYSERYGVLWFYLKFKYVSKCFWYYFYHVMRKFSGYYAVVPFYRPGD